MASRSALNGRRAVILTVLAFLWGVGLIVAALVVPSYGSATFVDENGTGELLVVAVPAVVSLVVGVALWRQCSAGGQLGGFVAWGGIAVLGAFSLVAMFSIGIFVIPAAVLLAAAALLTPPGPTPASVANARAG